jgi:hypothetical protein
MSTPQLFKFYLLDVNGNYYYYDGNSAQITATKTPIKDTPNGWSEMKIQLGRDTEYFGINSSITAPLKFWGDGREILKSIYYANGKVNFNAYCKCIIEQRIDHDGARVWQYEQLGNDFVIDFANEQSEEATEDGGYFVVGLNEENAQEIILSEERTEVIVEFDADSINTEISGKELQSNYKWITSGLGAVTIQASGSGTGFVVPMGLIKEETDYFRNLIVTQTTGSEEFSLSGTPNDNNKFLYTDNTLVDVPYTLDGEIVFQNTSGVANAQVIVEVIKKDTVADTIVSSQTLYSSTVGLTGTVTLTVATSGTLDFDPSIFTYFLDIRVGSTSAPASVSIQVNSMDFRLNITSILPAAYIETFSYYNFAKKLIAKFSNNQVSLASSCFLNFNTSLGDLPNYFHNLPKYTNVTTGNALRGLADRDFKAQFQDLKRDIKSRWMCGMDVTGNIIRFEQLPYFFRKNSVIATVDEVSMLTKKTAVEWLCNGIKCGYPDETLDKLNAKYEINSEQQYSLFLNKIQQELDITTNYNAGVYQIEYLKGDLLGKDTTDNDGDNKIFLLEVSNVISGGNNQLLRYSNPPDSLSGVFSPYTHYNWGLSPDLFIYRWSPYFKSILSSPDDQSNNGDKVSFVSAKKNDNYIRYIGGYVVNGGDNIFLTSSYQPYQGDKLFRPIIYEFECKTPENIVNKILADKYGVIQFYDNGDLLSGFIIDAEITPSNMNACKFTLLASPDSVVS